ncbi:uncharacterized protein A4U43_C07F6480, partial [Asparagus officinalis]
ARKRKWLQETPEASSNDELVVFDSSIISWWAWIKRYHILEAELLNGWKDQDEKSVHGPMAMGYKDIILLIVETIKEMFVLLMKILLQNVLQGILQ